MSYLFYGESCVKENYLKCIFVIFQYAIRGRKEKIPYESIPATTVLCKITKKMVEFPLFFDFPFSMSVVDRNGAVVGMIMFCLLIFPPTAFHREVEPLLTTLFPFFNLTSSYWVPV